MKTLNAVLAVAVVLVIPSTVGVLHAQAPAGQGAGPPDLGGVFLGYPQRVTDPTAVERGRGLYSVNCAFCHGLDARGGDMGPSLLRSQIALDDQNGELIGPVLLAGRPPVMPKFTLTAPQISDIAAFIHSFPVSSRTGPSTANIVVGDAKAGEAAYQTKCASCHSSTGDLQGVATKYADPKALQQTWLMPGSGGSRLSGGPPRPAPPITAIVESPSSQRVEGILDRIDDFVVSLRLADGTLRTFRTTGAAWRVELHDPLQGHKSLLGTYTDSEIHNLTAYLVTLK